MRLTKLAIFDQSLAMCQKRYKVGRVTFLAQKMVTCMVSAIFATRSNLTPDVNIVVESVRQPEHNKFIIYRRMQAGVQL